VGALLADGKILSRSTKETDKRRAIEFAKDSYDEVNYKQRQGLVLNSRADFELHRQRAGDATQTSTTKQID
jgi:hypothetical protein